MGLETSRDKQPQRQGRAEGTPQPRRGLGCSFPWKDNTRAKESVCCWEVWKVLTCSQAGRATNPHSAALSSSARCISCLVCFPKRVSSTNTSGSKTVSCPIKPKLHLSDYFDALTQQLQEKKKLRCSLNLQRSELVQRCGGG